MNHLTLSFFGAFQAMLGDKPLTGFRSAKVQGLLIYLALTPQHPHSREALATFFWPDEPEAAARLNLRQSLYRLRQVLDEADFSPPPEPFLLVTRSTVQFNAASNFSLDVTDFLAYLASDQFEQAVTLYRGDLLAGFTCASLPFEEWLRHERERLQRLALDTLFTLTDQSLARADYQTAQRLARQQLALEPWREEAHRQLMKTLALRGERCAALGQYESCRALLAEELGVEPSAETVALAATIRDQPLQTSAGSGAIQALKRPRLTVPFVGRAREMTALTSAYRQALHEGIQVVALVGEPGIGKSRLAQHFLDWAAMQGADVLVSRAFEASGEQSYQPFIHLLRPCLERENAPDDLLSDLWLTQLSRLLPELRDRYPDLPKPTSEEGVARQHLFEALTRLGRALAQRAPLVLMIDDWHWADAASLDMLHYAALRWAEEGAPILVLLTLGQEALTESHEVQGWLTRLKRDVALRRISLSAFSQAETEQLIRMLLEPEVANDGGPTGVEQPSPLTRFSRWLFAETNGQPLLLTETLKALVEDGLITLDAQTAVWHVEWSKFDETGFGSRVLPGVREIIRGWLGRITASARELLTAASVLAQQASFGHLCRVAGLEEIQAMKALEELFSKQLLLEDDQASATLDHGPIYTFSHQKISEVVYSEAGTARRQMLHRRAFAALHATAPSAELAHHARNAGLMTETIRYNLVAGNEAMDLFAVRVAIAHYETAWQLAEQKGWPEELSSVDRQALYASLGRAYELVKAWPQAQETYQTLIEYGRTIGAATLECLGLNHLAMVYFNGFRDRPQAVALLEQARTLAEASGDRRGLAETEGNLSLVATHRTFGEIGQEKQD
jgi:DNA-binding SARP family transcriptional activator